MWSKWTWRKIRALPEPSASAHGRRSHFGLVLFILFLPGAFFVLFGASQKKNPEVLASFWCWIQPGSAFPCFSLTLDGWAPKGEGRRRNKVVLFHFWRVKSSPGSFPAWRNLKIPFFWLEFHWKRGNFAGGWGFGRGVLFREGSWGNSAGFSGIGICGAGGNQHKMFGHSFPPPREEKPSGKFCGAQRGKWSRISAQRVSGDGTFPQHSAHPSPALSDRLNSKLFNGSFPKNNRNLFPPSFSQSLIPDPFFPDFFFPPWNRKRFNPLLTFMN